MMSFIEDIVLRKVKRCAGIYIWQGPEMEFSAALTVVALRRNKLAIEKSFTARSLDEIIQKIPADVPLIVSVDGVHVIHRVIENSTPDNPVQEAFPGIKIRDFIVQKHLISENRMIISLIRKEDIVTLVSELNKAGFFIFDLLMGPFTVDTLPGFAGDNGEISLPYYKLNLKDGKVFDFERTLQKDLNNSFTADFGEGEISSEYLASLSLCYGFFQSGRNEKSESLLSEQRGEFAAKKLIAVSGLPFVLLVFFVLVVNYSFYSHYKKETSILDQTILIGKQHITHIDSLQKAVDNRQKVLEAKQNEGKRFVAYYSDRIASRVPNGIQLQEMSIWPRINATQNRNSFVFRERVIVVNGLTDNSVTLEKYVRELSSFSWIESVRIMNFNESKDGIRSFRLELSIADLK